MSVSEITTNMKSNNIPIQQEKSENITPQQNMSIWKAAGIGLGVSTGSNIAMKLGVIQPVCKYVIPNLFNLTPAEEDLTMNAFKKAMDNTGLSSKITLQYTATIKNNAFFGPNGNMIILPEQGFGKSAILHELGHAHNFNNSKIGQFLWKMRKPKFMPLLGVATFTSTIIAFCKKPKKDGEKVNGCIDKVTDAIKNNIGKIIFASELFIPVEEGLASYKALNWAKKYTNSKLTTKMFGTLGLAWLAYLATAAVPAIAISLAAKYNDNKYKQV